jgi:hypothetical protein
MRLDVSSKFVDRDASSLIVGTIKDPSNNALMFGEDSGTGVSLCTNCGNGSSLLLPAMLILELGMRAGDDRLNLA